MTMPDKKTITVWVTRDLSPRSGREVWGAAPVCEHGVWRSYYDDGTDRFRDELRYGPLADVFPMLAPGGCIKVEVTVKVADGSDREFFTPEGGQ